MNLLSLLKALAVVLCEALLVAHAMDSGSSEPVTDAASPESHRMEDTAGKEKGIDVSRFQGKIDWDKVAKNGVKHVFVKMTEGGTYVDPNFVTNWNGAKDAGINVNCYHYFRALSSTPLQQKFIIKKQLKAVKYDPQKNALAIDVEAGGNENATADEMARNLKALLSLIKMDLSLSRLRVFIYTSHGYWDSKVNWNGNGGKYNFSAYPLWVAHYRRIRPILPEPWRSEGKSWTWWQYREDGTVDGILGKVDLDWVKP